MLNALPLILAALIAVGIIVIGCFYLVSPERISGTFGLGSCWIPGSWNCRVRTTRLLAFSPP
jgi:hypothetical protein